MAAPAWSARRSKNSSVCPPISFLAGVCPKFFLPRIPCARGCGCAAIELEAASAETVLPGAGGDATPHRVGVSVQVITEAGSRMGALVTLRDLESLERINRQLEVSERLAAMGRVTAGVAHEVKNPLNSMRLWLENLKENLVTGRGTAAPGGGRAG